LIYLNADLQKRILPIFHYALKSEGLLFLGPSETIGSLTNLFEPLDKRWKIFRRRANSTSIGAIKELPSHPLSGDERAAVPSRSSSEVKAKQFVTNIERLLLGRFAPASLVLNDHGDILYIHGHTGEYLEPAQGEPRNNAFAMARQGLEIELATAVRECIRDGSEVVREGVRVKTGAEYVCVDLTVTKIDEPESIRGLMLVTFRPSQLAPPESNSKKRTRFTARDSQHIEQLERELKYLQESHQTTQEELETSNEELKSSNEELQSTNEELQSTNEELETSKEEMQSLNEELTTVNAELQTKLDSLAQSNDDLQNLLNSTNIATVFLDSELNIKRFTEQSKELVMLRPTDLGRPISELASNLNYIDLVADCKAVLKTLALKEAEVQTNKGVWYLMRIIPYRTADNVIDGLVLTFVDIRQLKAGERAKAYFESIVNTVREPLIVLNPELRVLSANQSFYRTFQTNAKQTEGELIYELGASQWDVPKLRELLELVLPTKATVENYEVEVVLPKLGRRVFILNARRLEQSAGVGDLILLALEDATSDSVIAKRTN
ncbi:MAG: PAS domain-containing protein, partial [Pirellula sp.]